MTIKKIQDSMYWAITLTALLLGNLAFGQDRWENTIQAFETADSENPPPKNAILFVGSSSIVYWRTLSEDMVPLNVINRGFGGSQMHELNMYRDRIVTNYQPKAVVVYEGDNDVAAGKSVDEIIPEYVSFIEHLNESLDKVDIYLIAVKPSIARATMWETMQAVNEQLFELSKQHENVHYFDIASPMLQSTGEVKDDIFVEDGLHMNAAGYEIWTNVIRPVLLEKYDE